MIELFSFPFWFISRVSREGIRGVQQEAVAEKEHSPRYGTQGDLPPGETAVADALRSHAGEGNEQHAVELGRPDR